MVSTIKKFGIIVFITVMGALNVSAQSENSKVIVLLNRLRGVPSVKLMIQE